MHTKESERNFDIPQDKFLQIELLDQRSEHFKGLQLRLPNSFLENRHDCKLP